MLNLFFQKQKHPGGIKGFTLIETLVSAMVITIVILGPLTVANSASAYARQTKDTMVAVYLAQEAIELLRHQQDSIYLRCVGQTSTVCTPQNGETAREAAWRIFRDRLGTNGAGSSCFSKDSQSGCAYDFIDMTGNEDFDPPKYPGNSLSCSTISMSSDNAFVCSGVHAIGGNYKITPFSRSVFITSIETFPGADASYNDDLRVTVIVTFKRVTGYTKQIKVVDFLHSRA